jgi:hypothetical protein
VAYQVKQGANWLHDPENLFQHSYYKTAAGEIVDADVLGHDRTVGFPVSYYGYCPKPYKQSGDACKGDPFSTGHVQSYDATITGGADALNYMFFGAWGRDEGAVDYNWKDRLSGRSNLTFVPNDKVTVDFGLGYERSKLRSAGAQQPITTAILWSCPSPGCEPGKNLPNGLDGPLRGYLLYVPEVYEDNIQGYEDINRSTLTATLRHKPFGWFSHRLTVGGDFTEQQLSSLWKKISTVGSLNPLGRRDVENSSASYVSADYAAIGTVKVRSSMRFETSAGAQYYRKQNEAILAHGETFPVNDRETISSGALKTAQETFVENKTVGLYIQEQFAWQDRLYLTAALRGDGNSAFGKDYKATRYPKLSASWVSDEPFASNIPLVSSLKLRAAWGKAGQQPDAFAALRTYAPRPAPAARPRSLRRIWATPTQARGRRGIEAGFDASLFSDRMGLEFTWYSKATTTRSCRCRRCRHSASRRAVQNIGRVDNHGLERCHGERVRSANTNLVLGFKFCITTTVATLGGASSLVMERDLRTVSCTGYPLGACSSGASSRPTSRTPAGRRAPRT